MFILVNIKMSGKILMKHCQKKKDFYSNLNMEGNKNSDCNQKEFVKILKQKN